MEEYFTPIRQQYLKIKKNYPGAIVLFRLGDFYETFDEDAKLVSRELEITLTSKFHWPGFLTTRWTTTWPNLSKAATRSPFASK
jgi:DNA mismatch repair ATPase MutS